MSTDNQQKPQFVFTLDDDIPPPAPEPKAAPVLPARNPALAAQEDSMADWERRLEQLRAQKKTQPALEGDSLFAPPPRVTPPRHNISVSVSRPAAARVEKTQTRDVLDPVQRERVYQAYFQEWRHRTRQQEAQQQAEFDPAVLIQEDWLAAQECLQTADQDEAAAYTIRLSGELAEALPAADEAAGSTAELPDVDDWVAGEADADYCPETETAVTHVHLHVLEPQAAAGKAVSCISEQALLTRLAEKLQPHLADAMAGMVRVAVQKQTAHLISQLQQQLLAEIPTTVAEVLEHNLQRALEQVKRESR